MQNSEALEVSARNRESICATLNESHAALHRDYMNLAVRKVIEQKVLGAVESPKEKLN